MRKTYPSDITREQFEKILPTLEGVRNKTRPREVDLYDVFCRITTPDSVRAVDGRSYMVNHI